MNNRFDEFVEELRYRIKTSCDKLSFMLNGLSDSRRRMILIVGFMGIILFLVLRFMIAFSKIA